jgi:hypothetical protein
MQVVYLPFVCYNNKDNGPVIYDGIVQFRTGGRQYEVPAL